MKKDKRNNLMVEGDPDHPVNKGMLCSKGMNLHYAMRDKSDRLLYPEMRWSRSHPLQRVTWDEAMKRAAAVFASLIKNFARYEVSEVLPVPPHVKFPMLITNSFGRTVESTPLSYR